MATLATQNILRTGTVVSLAAASGGGDAMETGDEMMLVVKNASGGSINVTLAAAASTGITNTSYANEVVAVAAGATAEIGPVSSIPFKDPITGLCTITYSATASVTVGAKKLVG